MKEKNYALIVAGGNGNRMNSTVPKQFININGKPLLMHTFDAFLRFDPTLEFILVLPEAEIGNWKKLCEKFSFHVDHKTVAGGNTRFDSVKKGLKHIEGNGIVFIHDGVRPLVSQQTIENCYHTTLKKGNALPVIPPSESIREVSDKQNKAVDRAYFFLVQTPQTFRVEIIKKAYEENFINKYTDDASVLESNGITINLVPGNRENIKITYPFDIKLASILLE